MTAPHSTVDQARAALASLRAAKPRPRLQRDIVRDHSDAIIIMIKDDGATLEEVAGAMTAIGELVLEKGFCAEVRRQLGTVKSIRSKKVSRDIPLVRDPELLGRPSIETDTSDIDEDFIARKRRT